MISYPKETMIALGEDKSLYSEMRCYIRVEDEGGGPYLVIRGEYDGDDDTYKPSEFALESHKEIDEFCRMLHKLLRSSEKSSEDNMSKRIRKDKYPSWICVDCGNRYGRSTPGGLATYSEGTCGWCGSTGVQVTEPRDYGYPFHDASNAKGEDDADQ